MNSLFVLLSSAIIIYGYNFYRTSLYDCEYIFKWPFISILFFSVIAVLCHFYFSSVVFTIICSALVFAIASICALVIFLLDDHYYYRRYSSLKSMLSPSQYKKYKSTVIEVLILLFSDHDVKNRIIAVGKAFAENKIDNEIYNSYQAIKSKEDWISSYDLEKYNLKKIGYRSGTLKATNVLEIFNPDYKNLIHAYEKANSIVENSA